MKRSLPVLFGLLLAFAFVTSVVIAQRAAPVRLAPLSDGTLTLIYIPPPTPTAQPNTFNPGDPDGDGIPNGIDQCPDQGGPSSNNGCPLGTTGTVAQPSAPGVAPAVNLPTMPFTGDCVLATRGSAGVNVRAEPSIHADIVGVLNPQTLYPVISVLNDAEGVWDRIAAGWVARRVVRQGGNCDTLPEDPTYSLVSSPISCDVPELIDAIKNAPSGATITLAPGCIYTLTNAIDHVDYGNGHYGLPFITRRLIINGNGATIRRSSAGGTPDFAFFHVGNLVNLTLNNLTLRNAEGNGTGDTCTPSCGGGVILNAGGNLILNNVIFSHNVAYGGGGAIDNRGLLTVTDSTFSNNLSTLPGGAIANYGTLMVTNSTFSHNSMNSLFGNEQGGAIANYGTLTVTDTSFSDNEFVDEKPGKGAGIYNDPGGTLTVTNSTFSRNFASNPRAAAPLPGDPISYGGAIFNSGMLTVSSNTFSGNWANFGPNIYNVGT